MAGGDIEELLGGSRAFTTQLVHQGLASGARQERPDDVGVGDVRYDVALLRETPYVFPEGLLRLLPAVLEVPRVPRAFICALEVPDEDFPQVRLAGDLVRREMLEPGAG